MLRNQNPASDCDDDASMVVGEHSSHDLASVICNGTVCCALATEARANSKQNVNQREDTRFRIKQTSAMYITGPVDSVVFVPSVKRACLFECFGKSWLARALPLPWGIINSVNS